MKNLIHTTSVMLAGFLGGCVSCDTYNLGDFSKDDELADLVPDSSSSFGEQGPVSTTADSTTEASGGTDHHTAESSDSDGTTDSQQSPSAGSVAGADDGTPPGPDFLDIDACDDPVYEDATWATFHSSHFNLHYIPATAADHDMPHIVAARESAYANIVELLGITASPMIDVYLSPNRLAAAYHGLGMGNAYAGWDRYEVVYTGAANSFEVQRYGHELAHVLAYYADEGHPYHLKLLDEGLAEYLDQSGRDLHAAYAQNLTAFIESRTAIDVFDDRDAYGRNYGRAGSLVQFLVERYGMPGFLDAWRTTRVTWSSGCFRHASLGCVQTGSHVEALLDFALLEAHQESWQTVRTAWREAVELRLAEEPETVSEDDARALRNLVALTDLALNTDNAVTYRSTMEGFYCDWYGEAYRLDIAERAVLAYDGVSSDVLGIYATGISNFETAYLVTLRHESRGAVGLHGLYAEKFPAGWRISWAPDWH